MIDVRRVTRQWIFPAVTELWALAFRLFRPLLFGRQAPRSWEAGGRILVLAPHPDDETLGAGGAIALHRRHDDPVTVAIVTDGSGSQAGGLTKQAMARRRAAEVTAAVQKLGLGQAICLGLPEGGWDRRAMQEKLAPLVSNADVVYAPSCVDFHPDHLRVARLLAEMLQSTQIVRVYELSVPLTPLLTNLMADISPVAAQKRQALAYFTSQQAALYPLARLARYRAALYGVADAELFWEMPAGAYKRVMRYGTWGWEDSPFRGVRPRPFTDPLAFLAGRRARRRLRLLAQGGES